MCVEVYATYVCMHTVPLWVPCSTFSMKQCPKYQRQYRNRPLRCSCTCKAPVSLTEALQDNSFCDGLTQAQLDEGLMSTNQNPQQQQQQQQHLSQQLPQQSYEQRLRDSWSPESSSASAWSGSSRSQPNTPGAFVTASATPQMQYAEANRRLRETSSMSM